MSKKRRENLRRLHQDPAFAGERDDRAKARFTVDNERLQRLCNIAKRGCDVPDYLESQWRSIKQMKVKNRDAAGMLNIPWLGDPDDEADARFTSIRACDMLDDLIDKIETDAKVDPDLAYDMIEIVKGVKRVISWNTNSDRSKT